MGDVGIYKIEWENGYYYFGQTINLHKRVCKHKSQFNRGNNSNSIMQRLFNKYGMPCFLFVEKCEIEELDTVEQRYLDLHINNKLCCNILPTASSNRGFKLSIEARKKMSEWQIGRIIPLKARANMSASAKLKKLSDSHKEKIAIASKTARKHSKAAFNLQTGIFYDSLLQASESVNYSYSNFCKMLTGNLKNKTHFIYA